MDRKTSSQRFSTVFYNTRCNWKIGKYVFFLRFLSVFFLCRQSLTQDDVMMIVKLLSDWSEIYSSISSPEPPPKPRDTALLSLIKLLRNSCAGVPCNQQYLLKAGALAEILKLLLSFVTSHQRMPFSADDHRDVVVTATLQLLGNVCVGFRDGRDEVWRTFFPQTAGCK
jgi:hypothetical protein